MAAETCTAVHNGHECFRHADHIGSHMCKCDARWSGIEQEEGS